MLEAHFMHGTHAGRQIGESEANERHHVVLIVDDSQDAHEIYQKWLQDQDCEVWSAFGGREALLFLATGLRPDVIVVDMLMPQMDGMQFIIELRRDARFLRTPIIIASSMFVPPAIRLRDVRYLTKPFRPSQLLLALQDQMEEP